MRERGREREREIYIYIYTRHIYIHIHSPVLKQRFRLHEGSPLCRFLPQFGILRWYQHGVCLPTFPWTLPYLSWRISLFEALFCVGISKINFVEISADSWGCMFMSSSSYIHLNNFPFRVLQPSFIIFYPHSATPATHFFAPSPTPKKRWEGSPPSTKEQI